MTRAMSTTLSWIGVVAMAATSLGLIFGLVTLSGTVPAFVVLLALGAFFSLLFVL